ncbi:hypothetical protein B0H11DRAFT_2193479 [Mycena galericulata]|nr:hypothetical protein B0H11DRAFT_2193479 [Mycena galericulata]
MPPFRLPRRYAPALLNTASLLGAALMHPSIPCSSLDTAHLPSMPTLQVSQGLRGVDFLEDWCVLRVSPPSCRENALAFGAACVRYTSNPTSGAASDTPILNLASPNSTTTSYSLAHAPEFPIAFAEREGAVQPVHGAGDTGANV